ncbi:MAG: hypothetical protein Q8K11_02470 [Phenylobacterium sp.]|uniref:hypothetical protein n=1 Tax=Phenylobacterium sp. TaxID=1871053 RepID=UPI00273167C0|nr:hypothetical protein [Phenylobacterium sp.]MDP2009020.1 hypothetical protein [Phenylobacterium sp.]
MNPNDSFAPEPFPETGSSSHQEIYLAVGAALSAWEHSELHLTLVFSHLIGDGAHSEAAFRAYGSAIAFSARADMVIAAADQVLAAHPERDELVPKFRHAINLIRRASTRRNEIAHGAAFAYCSALSQGICCATCSRRSLTVACARAWSAARASPPTPV